MYLPRRGLIEVWSPEQKVKVTEFHVSKNGSLLRSAGVCLDDGLPRRRENIRLFTAFLQPNGKINHFYIPFHALSISSSAEKDIQVQTRVNELVEEKQGGFLEELVKLVEEIRNIQLRNTTISKLVGSEDQLSASQSFDLVKRLLDIGSQAEKSQSLDHKLYINRLMKLKQLIRLYLCTEGIHQDTEDAALAGSSVALDTEFYSGISGLNSDIILEKITESKEKYSDSVRLTCCDFIQSFDIEGELKACDIANVHMRKEVSPRIQIQLTTFFCTVFSREDNAQDRIAHSGLFGGEVLELLLKSFIATPNYGFILGLQKTMIHLLSHKDGGDDRTVSSLQDIAKRILLKANITDDLHILIATWMTAMKKVEGPEVYVTEWSRRLEQVSSFLSLLSAHSKLLKEESSVRYTLKDVYDCGNGRIAEIVSKWLLKLNSNSLHLPDKLEGFNDSVELSLVSVCKEFYPLSMNCDILVLHMCWEELQRWQQNKNQGWTWIDEMRPSAYFGGFLFNNLIDYVIFLLQKFFFSKFIILHIFPLVLYVSNSYNKSACIWDISARYEYNDP